MAKLLKNAGVVRNGGAVISFVRLQRRSFHDTKYDVGIVGGGIVGLATAQELLQRRPHLKCVVVEKEKAVGHHQTGHNSGVIHAGIYYKPGSLKAKLCWKGLKRMYDYCEQHNIPYKRVGKLIVAVSNDEVAGLQSLYDRGKGNGVEGLTLVTGDELKQIEPHCEGVAALYSPNTGIVDYRVVAETYAKQVEQRFGGIVVTDYKVIGLEYATASESKEKHGVIVHGENQPPINCRYLITCGGLQADRIAQMSGCSATPKLIPFRGDYLVLKPEKSHLVTTNIYPVPNAQFSFLGVHFTPRMDGSIWLGPNAILAFKREGYGLTDFNAKETWESLSYIGFRKFLKSNWRHAASELYKGFVISKTIEQARKFVPCLIAQDFVRGPSGVRAQALKKDGDLVDDFVFDKGIGELGRHCLHVRNAPSPAATSSLAIAEMIADRFEEEWKAIDTTVRSSSVL